jgi:hypothetical protein
VPARHELESLLAGPRQSVVITRPVEHDIDRAGKRLLRAVLEKLGWVLNDVEEDYGIDSNVQIFDGAHPTGAWFHVQLKSSGHSEYSRDRTFISQELSVDHARHYALDMRQPVLIIHADVTNEKVYWHSPQLDKNLTTTVCNTSAKSTSVRIPTCQELPQSAPALLWALDKAYLALANRELMSSSTQQFAESLRHLPDQLELANAFQKKNDVLRLRRILEFYRQERFSEARTRGEAVISDPDSDVETKFWALIQLHAIDYHETVHAGKPQSELPKLVLRHAKALQMLTRSGPNYLKFHALIARHAAELEVIGHDSFSLFMALRQHLEAGGNPMMILGLYARRAILTRQFVSRYNRCLRLAQYTTNYSDRWALGRALTNIVKALATFMTVLRAENHREYEIAFTSSALQVCKLATWISAETGDTEGIVLVIVSALLVVHSEDSNLFRWAQEAAQNIIDEAARNDALRVIDRATKRWKGEKLPGDYHGDTIWQVIQNIATGLGLNLSDQDSSIVQALRIAAKDNNPERVLLHCKHLLAAQGAMGPAACEVRRLFAIDTAGSKVIHCTLHDYHVEGRDLDTTYSEIKRIHCDSCPDASPRSSDWHYDERAWQLERDKYTGFVGRFLGKSFGLRYTDKD